MTDKVHDFKTIGHSNLASLAAANTTGTASAQLGTKASDKPLVDALEDAKKQKEQGPALVTSTPAPEADDWGRIFVYLPQKQIVKVVRLDVGKTFGGQKVHEVKNKAGKVFLANEKQLGDAK